MPELDENQAVEFGTPLSTWLRRIEHGPQLGGRALIGAEETLPAARLDDREEPGAGDGEAVRPLEPWRSALSHAIDDLDQADEAAGDVETRVIRTDAGDGIEVDRDASVDKQWPAIMRAPCSVLDILPPDREQPRPGLAHGQGANGCPIDHRGDVGKSS